MCLGTGGLFLIMLPALVCSLGAKCTMTWSCSWRVFHISLGKIIPGLNFVVVSLQVESVIFIKGKNLKNRICNLNLLPSPSI